MKKYRIFLVLFCSFLFCFHVSCTILFNFEKITENPKIRFVVFKYMFPFFNQNNKVFAPDPPFYKQELQVKYHLKNGNWSSFINPQKAMLQKHISNRFSPVGNQIKHYDYLLRHVYDAHIYADYYVQNNNEVGVDTDSLRQHYLKANEGYRNAIRYFSEKINQTADRIRYDSLQLQVSYIYPEKYAAKTFKNIKSSSLTIDFPASAISYSND